jgi:hypothetical protein
MPAARPGKSTKWKIFICRPKKQQSILQAWRIVHDERSKPTSLLPQTNSRARWAREENSSLAGRWKRERERIRSGEIRPMAGNGLFPRERRRPTRLNCSIIHRSPLSWTQTRLHAARSKEDLAVRGPVPVRGAGEERNTAQKPHQAEEAAVVINQSVRDYFI